MICSAELLVVMTDRLKIVRIHARNTPRVHGRKRLDDDAFLAFPSRSMKATVSRARCTGASSCWNKKSSVDNLLMSGSVAATVYPLHFDTKSEQSDCNKSCVR